MNWFRAGVATLGAVAVFMSASAQACTPVSIFFDWNSARLTAESRAAIERFALRYAWKGPELDGVMLSAFADTTGSRAANRAIALRRAHAVRDALLSFNVPREMIRVRAVVAGGLRVSTPDGVRSPYNRRVELLLQLSAEAQARQLEEGRPIC